MGSKPRISRTFNVGMGMVLAVDAAHAQGVVEWLAERMPSVPWSAASSMTSAKRGPRAERFELQPLLASLGFRCAGKHHRFRSRGAGAADFAQRKSRQNCSTAPMRRG